MSNYVRRFVSAFALIAFFLMGQTMFGGGYEWIEVNGIDDQEMIVTVPSGSTAECGIEMDAGYTGALIQCFVYQGSTLVIYESAYQSYVGIGHSLSAGTYKARLNSSYSNFCWGYCDISW